MHLPDPSPRPESPNAALTFTVRNRGTANLTDLSVIKTVTGAGSMASIHHGSRQPPPHV
jgi:hypothetical protein